jgi:D-lactate dehydrogenase
MKVAVFSTKPYDQLSFEQANRPHGHDFTFIEARLTPSTVSLAHEAEAEAVCVFINDEVNRKVLEKLAKQGIRLVALRCAGFNNVDLAAAKELGITVVRVPAYSPYAVAEHAVGLILMLNRRLYRAYNRVRDDNFALNGLLGFDLHGKTVGIVGTGKIGQCFAQIMKGFGCRLLAYDVYPNQTCLDLGVSYVDLPDLFSQSDVISLHCPLLPATHHMVSAETIPHMKPGVMLINTSRGALMDTKAVIEGIKSGQIGYLGTDVYEEEEDLFFEDLSGTIIQDDTFQLL